MSLTYQGNVAWVFPDNFDVDQIVGVKHIKEGNVDKVFQYCMKGFEEDFASKVKAGDILVAGENFGYGHPHSQGMGCMRKLGITVVVAESFPPVFYRFETGQGMVLVKVPGITKKVKRGDEIKVDFEAGVVTNLSTGEVIEGIKPSEIAVNLTKSGNLKNFVANELKKQRGQ